MPFDVLSDLILTALCTTRTPSGLKVSISAYTFKLPQKQAAECAAMILSLCIEAIGGRAPGSAGSIGRGSGPAKAQPPPVEATPAGTEAPKRRRVARSSTARRRRQAPRGRSAIPVR